MGLRLFDSASTDKVICSLDCQLVRIDNATSRLALLWKSRRDRLYAWLSHSLNLLRKSGHRFYAFRAQAPIGKDVASLLFNTWTNNNDRADFKCPLVDIK